VGHSPSTRLLLLCAAAVAAALAAAAGAQGASVGRLDSPRLAEIARAAGPIPDTELSLQGIKRLVPGTYWGGVYRTPTGENVTVYASNSYAEDPALGQKWADFLSTLVHGAELSSVIVFLAPLVQIGRVCGGDALACYSPQDSVLVAPGDDPADGISAEAVITHEYGHHVAAHRSNAPWASVDYGTKRWASYMQVCAKSRQGQLFPGAEDGSQYQLNPGEGYAEAYRLLNERRAGVTETPWQVVSDALYPDSTALSRLEQDVTTPWQTATATVRTGSITRTARARAYTIATQLDGSLRVSLRPSPGVRLALDVYASSTRVAHAVGTGTLSRSATICGQRSLRVRVTAMSGRGSFRLAVTKP
jgi:hypothetical protein